MVEYKQKQYKWPLSRVELSYFYYSEKMSMSKIAHLFGVDVSSVFYWQKKYKMPKIECWQRKETPSQLTIEQEQLILGYVLGDGYIGKNSKYAHLRVSQSEKQNCFVEYIYKNIKDWASYEPKIDSQYDKRNNKVYKTVRFDTVNHPEFNRLYDICYQNNKKQVNESWLNKIGEKGLAAWYQSDGVLVSKGVTPTLCTDSFSSEEQNIIIDWFYNKYKIKAVITKYGIYKRIAIVNGIEFKILVEPFILPFFNYKLPKQRRRKYHEKRRG